MLHLLMSVLLLLIGSCLMMHALMHVLCADVCTNMLLMSATQYLIGSYPADMSSDTSAVLLCNILDMCYVPPVSFDRVSFMHIVYVDH